MRNVAVIVSAGSGQRMGTQIKKQYLCLDKVPVLSRTLIAFDQCQSINEIILVIPKSDHQYCAEHILNPLDLNTKVHLADGGERRQDSVFNGLLKIKSIYPSLSEIMVLVHDGVRPFVTQDLINDCIEKAKKYGACVPGVQLTDTIKRAGTDHCIQDTVDRNALFSVQTPQVFKFDLLFKAFESAIKTGVKATDDASLVEHFGHPVFITQGSKFNIKLTTPDDLLLGEWILKQ